jgi:porin
VTHRRTPKSQRFLAASLRMIAGSGLVLFASPAIAQPPSEVPDSAPAADSTSVRAPASGDNRLAGDNPLYEDLYPLTNPGEELEEIYEPQVASVDVGEFESPLDFFADKSRALETATGLRISLAYTMIGQQASGGQGVRSGASGDLDLMFDWTLLGRGTTDTGRFIFTVEERFNIGPDPASAVGPGVGALTNTTGGFNDRGTVIRDVLWAQRLFDDELRLWVGRMDISDYFGGHRLQSINNAFSNRAFSALATAGSPGHGLGAVATYRPTEEFYVTVGGANAYGRTTTSTADRFFEDFDLFYMSELGFTPEIEGLGRGRYAVALWYLAEREDPNIDSDAGVALIAEQDLNETVFALARYQWADEALERIKNSVQVGLGFNGLLGSQDNVTGVAFGFADPDPDGLRDEKVIEAFHRWQLTRYTQFSLGAQLILDPSNAPDDDAVGVLTARVRIAF